MKNLLRIHTVALLLLTLLSAVRAQSIEFSYDYENGPPPNSAITGKGPITTKSSPTLPNSNRSAEHFISNSVERSEIRGVDNNIYGPGDDVWYVVSYYFPTGWHTSTPGEPTYTILNQLIPYNGASNDQQDCRAVFTCNRVNNGCSKGAPASDLTINPSGSTFTYRTNYYTRTSGGKNYFDCESISFPAGLDQWHTIVFHLRIGNQAGQGLLEVWHNGDRKYSKQRDVVLPGRTTGEWKYGAYVGDPNHGTRRVFTDDFYAGKNFANLNAFLAATPYGGSTTPDPEPEPDPDPRPCADDNLALSGSIHSVSSQQSGNPATNLIDGVADDDANRWSAQSFPQWVILDLGSVQSIGATRLQGYQDRAYQYQVYASSSLSAVESNEASALVADASSNSVGGMVEQRFAPTQARYVKVEVVGASNYAGDWVSAREVTVLSSCEEEPEGPSDPGQGSLSIRAQGDCGSEVMELHVDGAKVDEWTVSTAMDDYEYAGFTGGQVSVHLVNDQLEPCDRNLTVDYITVCGSTYQTEEVATETATCCTNNPEKLFTNGNFDFGTLACSSSATPQGATQTQARVDLIKNTTEIEVYPNPGTNGVFRLKNELKGELTVTDLRGRTVAKQPTSDDKTVIDLSGEPNGVYLLRTSTGQTIKLIKE